MGKISDALEKHQKETEVKTEPVFPKITSESLSLDSQGKRSGFHLQRQKIAQKDFDPKLVVLTAPDSYEAENFKLLRAQIMFARDRKRPKTIMVTSATPADGKTFVAANLAASIAMGIDEHVLLVDCDLRRADMHTMFGMPVSDGLREYLIGERQLSDILIKTKIEKLTLLPAGHTPPNPSELLASGAMVSFLEEIRGRYDDRIIILDTAPSQVLAEANVLSNFVDGIIFVVRSEKTPRALIRKAIDGLGREKILGVVFNGYSHEQKTYGKYYQKYYKQ
jgi:protein-tyrosine kinase